MSQSETGHIVDRNADHRVDLAFTGSAVERAAGVCQARLPMSLYSVLPPADAFGLSGVCRSRLSCSCSCTLGSPGKCCSCGDRSDPPERRGYGR